MGLRSKFPASHQSVCNHVASDGFAYRVDYTASATGANLILAADRPCCEAVGSVQERH